MVRVVQEGGPPKHRKRNVAKKLRNRALKAACKAAEQATKLAGDAASPSQVSLLHWLAEQNPSQNSLAASWSVTHMHSLYRIWVCGPLRLTSLSLPPLFVRAAGYAHV